MATIIRKLFASLLIALTFAFPLRSQEIIYGSNHGKYIEVLGRNIYYEEYGKGGKRWTMKRCLTKCIVYSARKSLLSSFICAPS